MSDQLKFGDRRDGGRRLAEHLGRYAQRSDVVVLGLPRGGVPVAAEVSSALAAPLDVFLVRKLGVPGHEELAMGAIASGGVRVLNEDVVRAVGITERELDAVAARELQTLEARERAYRGDRGPLEVRGRTAILVDDGLATGATAAAAVAVARGLHAARVVMAVPVGAPEAVERLTEVADEVVCPLIPPTFGAVSRFYQHFGQVSTPEVVALLR